MANAEYITYPVRIKIVSQKGKCAYCHKVGDEWICKHEPGKPPEVPDICFSALSVILGVLDALWWGATIPAPTHEPGTYHVVCPDPYNRVTFELKRLKDQPIHLKFGRESDFRLDYKQIASKLKE